MVFIATPHNGSEAAPLAKLVANAAEAAWRRPNKKLFKNLSQDSDVLEAQRGSFASVSQSLPIRCIYEELPTMGLMVRRPDSFLSFKTITNVARSSPSTRPSWQASTIARLGFVPITMTFVSLRKGTLDIRELRLSSLI